MEKNYSIFIALIAIVYFQVKIDGQLLTTTCTGSTCSPSICANVSNAACNATSTNSSVASAVSRLKCLTTFYQSNDTRCTNAQLNSVFAKGIGNGIKAIYCTDKYLIIYSDGSANHPTTLNLIPHPPGGGTGSYASSCVTRSQTPQVFSWRIPLNPVELPTASLSNNVNSFVNNMLPTIPLPGDGPVGVAVNGCPIYPPYNNVEALAWANCEVDACNAHAGQGFDYHYHGDPYGPNCMYSSTDYTSPTAHPPITGYSLDGFKIYGRYLNETAEGYSIALDICGGHTHGTYGYHYHAQVLSITTTTAGVLPLGTTYTAYINGPYKCWKGDVSTISDFGLSSGAAADEYLRPSCATTQYYAASGVTINVNLTATIVTTTASTTTSTTTTTKKSDSSSIMASGMLIMVFPLLSLFKV